MSSVACAIPFSVLPMELVVFSNVNSRDFFLSSESSNWSSQYSFLCSSSSCSCFSIATMSSIIATTFAKDTWRPERDSMMRSNFVWPCWSERRADRTDANASLRMVAEVTSTCIRPTPGAGNVFLKSSRASSSFNILMVSASARSSAARVFLRSSHSAAFVSHPFSSSVRKVLSSARLSDVSPMSSLICTMATPRSPIFVVLASIASVREFTSAVLAFMSSPYVKTAFSSADVIVARLVAMSSPSCFSRPTISDDPAAE
mmetsp:Transcript_87356/g.231203  ORF Transcript_87356/g.231203 Transcript_87356/m.231203 type:complete len:259 (-) Transcript_87356:656-1432(-)